MRAFVIVFLLVALLTTLIGFSTAAPLSYVLLAVGIACYGWSAGILLVEHLKEQRSTLDH